MLVKVQVKKLGKSMSRVEPVDCEYPDGIHTVSDLLEAAVHINLEEYRARHRITDVAQVLSPDSIENQAKGGRISFGLSENRTMPDSDKALQNARQCFEDGIAVLFVDGVRKERLDEPAELREGSELVFVRMTMLAGRMW